MRNIFKDLSKQREFEAQGYTTIPFFDQQEIQDLLLIAIYQKMHEQKIWLDNEDLPLEETEEDTIN